MENNTRRIYLDYAATTPVRQEVIDVMLPIFENEYGNPSSIYRSGREAKKIIEESRSMIAQSINADSKEIYFTSCGSEADNWAIKGTLAANKSKGKHIVTSAIEHHAVYNVCKSLEKQGYEVSYAPVDELGIVDPGHIEDLIRPDTVLVSVMMANNEIGTIQPVEEIAEICKRKNVTFHTDAVQVLGSLNIDVKKIGADLIAFSGHKIYAPKGVGALYIKKGTRISPFIEGGSQERRKRAGTENVPYIAGFAKAFQLSCAEREEYAKKMASLRDELIEEVLSSIPHARLNGHREKRLPGNVNFSFEFVEGESLLLMLDNKGFECSSGSACTSGSLDPSHVLLAIGLPHEIAHGSLRISFGRYNKREDIKELVDTIKEVVSKLREMSPLYEDYLKGKITEPNCMFAENSSFCKETTGCYKRKSK